MSTASLVLDANQSGTAYTADLNDALAAVNTCHSGSTAPTTEVATGKFWVDTSGANPVLKIYRNGWRSLFTLNASSVSTSVSALTATTASVTGTLTVGTISNTTTMTGVTATFSGDVSSPNFLITSDARLKTDILDLDDALAKVCKLRGTSFQMNGKKHIGVIAQEVEEVVPELVSTNEEGYKSVAYANTVALLIEAVKEQQAQIEELKAKVAELEK